MQESENNLIGGRYRIIDKTPHGLKCKDDKSDEITVWLKPMQTEIMQDPVLLEEAVIRCEALKNINHPAIAHMLDVVKADDGITYMVMEYADGVTLRRWMQAHRQDGVVLPAVAMPILKQLASALDSAHVINELHRHLTPDCIMIDDKGNAKILNYGIPYAGSDNAWMLEPFRAAGWEAFYRAPEQWRGQVCTIWTDMYALGCIAYEMLSGHVPFDIPDLSLLHSAVLDETPPFIISLSVAAQATVARCLAKNGSARFSSCDDYIRSLAYETTSTKTVPRTTTGRVPSAPSATLPMPSALQSASNPYVPIPQDTGTLRTTTGHVPVTPPNVLGGGTRPLTRVVRGTQHVTGRVGGTQPVTGRLGGVYPHSTGNIPYENTTGNVPYGRESSIGGSWGEDPTGAKSVLFKFIFPFFISLAIIASMLYILMREFSDEDKVSTDIVVDGTQDIISNEISAEKIEEVKDELKANGGNWTDSQIQTKAQQLLDKVLPPDATDKGDGKTIVAKNHTEMLSGQETESTIGENKTEKESGEKQDGSERERKKNAFANDELDAFQNDDTGDDKHDLSMTSLLKPLIGAGNEKKTADAKKDGEKKTEREDVPSETKKEETVKDVSPAAFFAQSEKTEKTSVVEKAEKDLSASETRGKGESPAQVLQKKDDSAVQVASSMEEEKDAEDKEKIENKEEDDEENEEDKDRGIAFVLAMVDGVPVDGAEIIADNKIYTTPDCEIKGPVKEVISVMVKAFYQDDKGDFYYGEKLLKIDWTGRVNVQIEMKKKSMGIAKVMAMIDGKEVDDVEISAAGKKYKTPTCIIEGPEFGESTMLLKALYQDEKQGFFSGEMLLTINWIGKRTFYVEMKKRKEISQAGAKLVPLNVEDMAFDPLKGKTEEGVSHDKALIMELLWVEPGSFEMGSDAEEVKENEKPAHTVQISNGFWLGKYEVTQEEYKSVAIYAGLDSNKAYFSGEKLPVENITREEAQKWCEALTLRERNAGRLPDGYEYRLPTEAEWEFAARGGKKGRGYLFSGSNDLMKVGWFSGNSEGVTKEVGLKKENELGFCDMSGNVREWCHDKYQAYTLEAVVDPLGHGTKDISRGGSCINDKIGCRLTERGSYPANTKNQYIGFRVALAPVLAE